MMFKAINLISMLTFIGSRLQRNFPVFNFFKLILNILRTYSRLVVPLYRQVGTNLITPAINYQGTKTCHIDNYSPKITFKGSNVITVKWFTILQPFTNEIKIGNQKWLEPTTPKHIFISLLQFEVPLPIIWASHFHTLQQCWKLWRSR